MRPTEPREVTRLENEIVARFVALTRYDTETIRNLRREFSKRLAKNPPTLILALALSLTRSQIAPRFVAYELIQNHRKALRSLKAKSLEELGSGNDSWEEVDTFACYLAGPAWREQQVSDALISRWVRSGNRWWRRPPWSALWRSITKPVEAVGIQTAR